MSPPEVITGRISGHGGGTERERGKVAAARLFFDACLSPGAVDRIGCRASQEPTAAAPARYGDAHHYSSSDHCPSHCHWHLNPLSTPTTSLAELTTATMPQDMPPAGGYEPVQYRRNLPVRGFKPWMYLAGVAGAMTYGFWRVGQGIREQK